MTTVLFLGLGHMGGPMAANLAAAGHRVLGFDLVPEALEKARAAGVETVSRFGNGFADLPGTENPAFADAIARTAKRGTDELTLETDSQSLAHPMAMVQLRHLPYPGENRRA